MDETLLDIAKRNLWSAKALYNIADDEGKLNIVAYHAQQCVELALKHYIEEAGFRYPHTHDIGALCTFIKREQFVVPFDLEGLSSVADMLTAMEAKTRYAKNYRYSRDVVGRAIEWAERCTDTTQDKELDALVRVVRSLNTEVPIAFIRDVHTRHPGEDALKVASVVLQEWEMCK